MSAWNRERVMCLLGACVRAWVIMVLIVIVIAETIVILHQGHVNDVADTIGRLLGKPVERDLQPPRAGDIRDSYADLSAARETLGYAPAVELEEGLRRSIELLQA